MPAEVQYIDCGDNTFDDAVPEERDQYFVMGQGSRFFLVPVVDTLNKPTHFDAPFGVRPGGLVGITSKGEIGACLARWARETAPMAPAAAVLAVS